MIRGRQWYRICRPKRLLLLARCYPLARSHGDAWESGVLKDKTGTNALFKWNRRTHLISRQPRAPTASCSFSHVFPLPLALYLSLPLLSPSHSLPLFLSHFSFLSFSLSSDFSLLFPLSSPCMFVDEGQPCPLFHGLFPLSVFCFIISLRWT